MKNSFLFLFLPFFVSAQNAGNLFETYMQGQVKLYGFSGNVLLAKNGKIIYRKSFGYADETAGKKLDDNSVFDCGSITKQFTAMAILILKDKGKISFEDTLGKFFPELPYPAITVHQLLTHTSGMPDGFGLIDKYFDHSKIAYNDDLIRLLAREKPPLLFKPGENLMYSGTGYNLLASIIEKVSRQSYNEFIKEQIFKPLGMNQSKVANGPRSPESIKGLCEWVCV
jgi:CubicO group peptidase (beta-lactamase class C family)